MVRALRRSQVDNARVQRSILSGLYAGPSLRERQRAELARVARKYVYAQDTRNEVAQVQYRGMLRGMAWCVALMEHPYDHVDHIKAIEREAVRDARAEEE